MRALGVSRHRPCGKTISQLVGGQRQGRTMTGACQKAALLPEGSRTVTWQLCAPGGEIVQWNVEREGHGLHAIIPTLSDQNRARFLKSRDAVQS